MMSKNKVNKKKIKSVFKFIIIAALFCGGITLLILSPLFNISTIQVSGNQYYKSEDIIAASALTVGANGFKNINGSFKSLISLRFSNSELNIINKLPYIKDAKVKYLPPNKVLIEVKERNPIALVPYTEVMLVIDREAYVLEVTNSESEENSLPVAKGLEFDNYQVGQTLKIENIKNFEKLIILLDALTEEEKSDNFKILNYITMIDISDIENVYIFVDSRLLVNYGDLSNLNYKIRAFKQIFFKNINLDEKGILDFTKGEYPVFIPDR